jgi:hypothetical protein
VQRLTYWCDAHLHKCTDTCVDKCTDTCVVTLLIAQQPGLTGPSALHQSSGLASAQSSSRWEDLRGVWRVRSATLVLATSYAGFWAAPLSWAVVAVSELLKG